MGNQSNSNRLSSLWLRFVFFVSSSSTSSSNHSRSPLFNFNSKFDLTQRRNWPFVRPPINDARLNCTSLFQAHTAANSIHPNNLSHFSIFLDSTFNMQKLSVLFLSMLFASAVSADALDDAIALFKRQSVALSTGGSDSASDTSSVTSSDDTTTASTSVVTTTPTTSDFTPTVVVSSTITSSPTSTSQSVVIVETTSTFTPTDSQGSTTETSESVSTITTSTTAPSRTLITTSSYSEVITTITSVKGGSTVHVTSTGSSAVPITTSVDPASLTNGGSSSGSSGLSETAKKTIGGVVGGVGGALLLAGLAYTAWRIWGKKKNLHDDDLYDPNLNQDKLSATTGSDSTPFQRTLDQYHSPGPVNTASNF